jgi:hypothetical protein
LLQFYYYFLDLLHNFDKVKLYIDLDKDLGDDLGDDLGLEDDLEIIDWFVEISRTDLFLCIDCLSGLGGIIVKSVTIIFFELVSSGHIILFL